MKFLAERESDKKGIIYVCSRMFIWKSVKEDMIDGNLIIRKGGGHIKSVDNQTAAFKPQIKSYCVKKK